MKHLKKFEDLNQEDQDRARKTAVSNSAHLQKAEAEEKERREERSRREDPDGMYPRDDIRYSDDKVNEGIGTILLTTFLIIRFFKLLLKSAKNKFQRKIILELLRLTKLHSAAKISDGDNPMKDALTVAEFSDRYYITMSGMLAKVKDIRILKKEKQVIIDMKQALGDDSYRKGEDTTSRIQLTDQEYSEFLDIIKDKI